MFPKNANQTCQSFCTARGQVCGVLSYSGVLATGEMVYGADRCQAPYIRGSFDGVSNGSTIPITDTESSYFCQCSVPPR